VSKEESREKLIRELQDLGQLIAPDDGRPSEADPPDGPAPLPKPVTDTYDDVTAQTKEADVHEGPETVDMFVADGPPGEILLATNSDAPEIAPQPYDQGQDQGPAITQTAQPAASGPTTIDTDPDALSNKTDSRDSGDYLNELVDELVGAVEKRLSLQSGESLPESLRDQLSRDIKDRLSPWWSEG
tara:strand:- start:4046 stop:4603 length:558 start_codon:yes stop_codon:yes gene_type:complete